LTTTRSCSGRNLVLAMTVPFGGSIFGLICHRKWLAVRGVFDTANGVE
jgi:hypothetical protein